MHGKTNILLIDIGPLCECGTDHALEEMHKALSEPSRDDDIWRPHESTFIRQLIEEATKKGVAQIDGLKKELTHYLERTKFAKPAPRPEVDVGMVRWSKNLMGAVKAYLDGVPQASWTVPDYVLLIDYLVQKYLPADFAMEQADWLVKRATLMGKVQHAMRSITPEVAEVLMAVFADAKQAEAALRLANMQQSILDYGKETCADHIVGLTEKVRHSLKRTILDYEKARILGEPVRNSSLQQTLMDNFAELNRDWRRIALTEAGEMANQGLVAGCKPGEKIKRVEQYANACAFCKKWDGKVLTVVDPREKKKDGNTQVWAGKTNVGRSSSPYKRVGGVLVKRPDDELWWPAAGTFHPHCRGQWVQLGDRQDADEFSLWLDGILEKQGERMRAAASQVPA